MAFWLLFVTVVTSWLLLPHIATAANVDVAFLFSTTGSRGALEEVAYNGALLAVSELNAAGGVLGKTINVVSADPGSVDSQYAAQLSNIFTTNPNTAAVFGGGWNAEARAQTQSVVASYASHLWYPYSYEGQECSQNTFYFGASPYQQVEPVLGWLLYNNIASESLSAARQLYLVGTTGDTYTTTVHAIIHSFLQQRAAVVAGTMLCSDATCSNAATIASDIAAKLPSHGVIVSTISNTDVSGSQAFYAALLAQGLTPANWPVMSFSLSEVHLADGSFSLPQVTGQYAAWHFASALSASSSSAATFVTAYNTAYSSTTVTDAAESAYCAVKMWAHAVGLASSFAVEEVRRAAYSSRLSCPAADRTLNSDHHTEKSVHILKVQSGSKAFDVVDSLAFPRPGRPWSFFVTDTQDGYGCDWFTEASNKYPLSTVKVGIMHSFTGALAISEKDVVDAELLAIDQINARGGVLGKFVVPVLKNGDSTASTFVVKAQELTTDSSISTVFGCWTSASRSAVKPVFEANDKLLWYPVQYEGQECSKNIFYTGATPNQQLEPALTWLMMNKNSTLSFFLVGSDYVFPRTANQIMRAYLDTYGRSVVGEMYLPLGDSTVGPIIASIQSSLPEGGIILNTLNGDSNVAFFQAMTTAGMTADTYPVMSFSITETEINTIGSSHLLGHYATWNYFHTVGETGAATDSVTILSNRFVEKFRAVYGKNRLLNDPMEAAYIMVNIWKQAVEDASSFNVSDVRAAAYGQSYDAPEGTVTMNANHHLNKYARVGQVRLDGLFDVVYTRLQVVAPQPWNQYVGTTRGYACDWSDSFKGSFYTYNSVQIGLLNSLTGSESDSGMQIVQTQLLAIDEINSSYKLRGIDITILPRLVDGRSNATHFATALTSLMDDQSIVGVFGGLMPIEREAMRDVMFSHGYTKPLYFPGFDESAGCSSNMIIGGDSFNQQLEPAVTFARNIKTKSKFVLISSTDIYEQRLSAIAAAYIVSNGGEVVLNSSLASSAVTSEVDFIMQQLPTICPRPKGCMLFNFMSASVLNRLLFTRYDTYKLSMNLYPILSFRLPESQLNSQMQLHYASSSYFESLQTNANNLFRASVKGALSKTQVVDSTMEAAYNLLYIWSVASRAATSYDGVTVRNWAYNSSFEAPQGTIHLTTSNRLAKYGRIAIVDELTSYRVVYPLQSASRNLILPLSDINSDQTCYQGPPSTWFPDEPVRYTVYSASSLAAVLIVFVSAVVTKFRASEVIRNSSYSFCMVTLVGLLLSVVAAIVIVMEPSDGVCTSRVWLGSLSVILVFSSLFAKTWRLHKLFNNPRLAKLTITNTVLAKVVACLLFVHTILLAIWTGVDPPRLVVELDNNLTTKDSLIYRRGCSVSVPFVSVDLFIFGSLLCWGAFLAWRTRKLPSKFNETQQISFCIFVMLFFGIILLPINFLIADNPAAVLVVRGLGFFFGTSVVTVALFGPKLMNLHHFSHLSAATSTQTTQGLTMHSKPTGRSRSPQNRYMNTTKYDVSDGSPTHLTINTPVYPPRPGWEPPSPSPETPPVDGNIERHALLPR